MARRKKSYHDNIYYFPPSKPREAEGGIKAQSRRGAIGSKWWAKRWIKVLESFNIGARLSRGRSYARKGQVLSIDIEPGNVSAKVQGSRARAYTVAISVKTISKKGWMKVVEALSRQALFTAQLLAGEMPEDIERVFESAGVSLFPGKRGDLKTDCSCPDWSNPCKHIAAVYYLIGEEFDRDPFLLFKLRGMERSELIRLIESQAVRISEEDTVPLQGQQEVIEETEPLPLSPGEFWGSENDMNMDRREAHIPSVNAAIIQRLGPFPFWKGNDPFVTVITDVYKKASEIGMNLSIGELGNDSQ